MILPDDPEENVDEGEDGIESSDDIVKPASHDAVGNEKAGDDDGIADPAVEKDTSSEDEGKIVEQPEEAV